MCLQAKLKSLHEVVVRNRLEQLRKRQRDEAILAQEELLAGVATKAAQSKNWGGDMRAEVASEGERETGSTTVDEVEEYNRSMSPELLDITTLPFEDRQVDILTAEEDRTALVRSASIQIVLFDKLTLRSSFLEGL